MRKALSKIQSLWYNYNSKWICRDVCLSKYQTEEFTWKRVINPEYEIIKGSKGGLAKCENNKWFWQDFVPSIGYVKTRDMDRDEEHAYLAIQKYWKFANSNIRM